MIQWIKRFLAGSSKQAILDSSKPKTRKLYVPYWDRFVYIRKLSVGDAKKIRETVDVRSTEEKTMEQLEDELEKYITLSISSCVLDQNYEPIFTEDQVRNFDNDVYNFLSLAVIEGNKLNISIDEVREELKKAQAKS